VPVRNIPKNATGRCVTKFCYFVPRVVNACTGIITLEEGRCVYEHISGSGWNSCLSSENVVGAWQML